MAGGERRVASGRWQVAGGRWEAHPGGSALFVETAHFARPAELSPNVGHGHHWYGNAESYFLIGEALAKGAITLIGKTE